MDRLGLCQGPEVRRGAVHSPCRTGRRENWAQTGLFCLLLLYHCQLCCASCLFCSPCWVGCRQGSLHHPEGTQKNRSQQLLLNREDTEKHFWTPHVNSHRTVTVHSTSQTLWWGSREATTHWAVLTKSDIKEIFNVSTAVSNRSGKDKQMVWQFTTNDQLALPRCDR